MELLLSRLLVPIVNNTVLSNIKRKANPRAIQFTLHYIFGSQKTMQLTGSEYVAIRDWIVSEMLDFYFFNPEGNEYDVDPNYETYGNQTLTQDYLTSKTLGIVGGFNYKIDSNGYFNCYDTWDFNASYFSLAITLPFFLCKSFQFLLNLIGIDSRIKELRLDKDGYETYLIPRCSYNEPRLKTVFVFEVVESKLSSLNERHAFKTEWRYHYSDIKCDLKDKPSDLPF